MMRSTLATWVQYVGMMVAMAGGAPWPHPNVVIVAVGMAIIGLGIVWKRSADKDDPRLSAQVEGGVAREGSVASAIVALPAMVTRTKALLAALEAGERVGAVVAGESVLTAAAREIEAIQQSGTEAVAASQEAFVRGHSFATYASVMSPLASAERWLYRAWSAASDGHGPEAIASVRASLPYLDEAQAALDLVAR